MKLQFYKNIDVVQINIKAGVKEYFFPQNVDWADKKIDKMIVYSSDPVISEKSPIDGVLPVLTTPQLQSVYFDLYNKENVQIAYNMSVLDILHTNNNPIEINSDLSLQMSKITFMDEPESDACLLVYVFWGTNVVDTDDVPNRNVTVQFELYDGQELPLSEVIDTYIHSQSKTLKGIYVWGGKESAIGLYLTLRDYNFKTVVKLLPGMFCRPPMGTTLESGTQTEKLESIQKDSMYLDCADIDFDNSFVYYSTPFDVESKTTFTITFLY